MTEFVTKDSGERQTFATGMQRDSAAKDLRPDLIYGPMLVRWKESQAVFGNSHDVDWRVQAFLAWLDYRHVSDAKRFDAAAEMLHCIDMHEKLSGRGPLLVRWSELMGRGANKYGERNWEKARTPEELERFFASLDRHFVQWFFGMNPEEDHAAAIGFNISGAEYVKQRIVEDHKAMIVPGIKCPPDSERLPILTAPSGARFSVVPPPDSSEPPCGAV